MVVEFIAIIISLISLCISIYILTRNKAILVAEKHSLILKKKYKEIWVYFYLTNIGEKPTTIKSIDFYTKNKFMPKTTILKVIDKTIIGIGEELPTSPILYNYEPINFPLLIEPHITMKLLAKLNFSNENIFEKETRNDNLQYTLRIKHSNKLFKKRI